MACFVGVFAREAIYPKTKANDSHCCLEVCNQLCLVRKVFCNAEIYPECKTSILCQKLLKAFQTNLLLHKEKGFLLLKIKCNTQHMLVLEGILCRKLGTLTSVTR